MRIITSCKDDEHQEFLAYTVTTDGVLWALCCNGKYMGISFHNVHSAVYYVMSMLDSAGVISVNGTILSRDSSIDDVEEAVSG